MSRNHVSKMLVGTGFPNTELAPVALAALTEGQIVAFDFDKASEAVSVITAATVSIGFARGTKNLKEPILAGPIPVDNIREALKNPFANAVNQVTTLTVGTQPDAAEVSAVLFKVIYHDNLSIIPNQIKSTIISVATNSINTASATAWAQAIADEFNLQSSELGGNLFVTVEANAAVVTFTGITLVTQSNYNGIDRPESLKFEVGAPVEGDDQGKYTIATSADMKPGQGDPAKIAWLEEQHMGRLGYADRRMWNTKKYQSQLIGADQYDTLVINADLWAEGDMQGVRANPVGAVIAAPAAGLADILTDIAVAGIVPVLVDAHN